MKKIMFSDKFMLTQAVLECRKTQTRRLLTLTLHKKADRGNELIEVSPSKVFFEDGKWKFVYDDYVFLLPKENYPKYRVGEVVAVAQSYEAISNAISKTESKEKAAFYCKVMKACFPDAIIHKDKEEIAGWYNKMFTRAELMPHQIRITDVRVERLQDISDDDCLKEGIVESLCEGKDNQYRVCYYAFNGTLPFCTPREAFAHLINKVIRKDVWEENPYVFVYDFELVKR